MKQIWNKDDCVIFYGDSVTDCGRYYQDPKNLGVGYANNIATIYRALFPEANVTFMNSGVSGNRTKDLLERYEDDVLAKKPSFISILIGINDVWRRFDRNDPTPVEQIEENYRNLLEKIKADLPECKIMIIEPFLLDSLEERLEWLSYIEEMNRSIRKLAREYADHFLALDGIFQTYLHKNYTSKEIAPDGVHPGPSGHGIIAYEFLKLLDII